MDQILPDGYTWLSVSAIVILSTLLAVVLGGYLKHFVVLKMPPGPFPLPFLGNYLSILQYGFKNTHVLFEDLHRRHGAIYTFWNHGIGMKPVVSVNSPVIAQAVLSNRKAFRSRGSVGWESFIPHSLLILPTNAEWAFHRRLVAPCFSEAFQQVYFKTFQSFSQAMVRSWLRQIDQAAAAAAAAAAVGGGGSDCSGSLTLDAHEQLTALTLDVIGKCGFGQDFNVRANPSCYFARAGKVLSLEAVKRAYQPRWMWYLDAKRTTAFKRALEYYHQMVADIRRGREALSSTSPTPTPTPTPTPVAVADTNTGTVDMLSTMIRARDKSTGKALTDAEIVDQITTFLLAGHETTANTLAWAVHLLSRNPTVQDKLRAEIRTVYGTDPGAEITYAQSKELRYAQMVICETLRLFPVLPRLMREASQRTSLAGYDIPKGARVRISLINMHRSTELWGHDALDFRPERFDDERYLRTLKAEHVPGTPFAYLPFGAGVRTCIGRRFALTESVTALCNIIKSFALAPEDPTKEVEMKSDITMGPKDGLRIRLTPVE